MSDRNLTNRIAVVTGASRGIGAAAAHRLAAGGATVVLAARGKDALANVVERIERGGGTAVAIPTDMADPAGLDALMGMIADRWADWTSS